MYSFHLFFFSSSSTRSLPFLSFVVPIFGWNVSLIFPIFLKRFLVFPHLLFPSIFMHCSLKKAFSSLLTILWNSTFPFLPCFSLLSSATCQASSDNHFAFLLFHYFISLFLFGRSDVTSPNSEWLVVQSFQKKQSENSVNGLMLPDTGYMSLCDQWEGLISSLIIWELGQGPRARDQAGKHSLERLNIPLASDMLSISVACLEIWICSEAFRLKKKMSTSKIPLFIAYSKKKSPYFTLVLRTSAQGSCGYNKQGTVWPARVGSP